MSSPFASRPLRRLFAARFVSVTGDKMFAIALAWWVVADAEVPNREQLLGWLMAVATLPIALSGPLLGPVIDRVDKRSCLVVADFGRLLLAGALAAVLHNGALTVPLLFGLCIPLFALTPLFDAAASASLSRLSSGSRMLAQVVALDSAIPNLASALGALCGAWSLTVWGVEGAFWFNAATFLLSLILVARLPRLGAGGAGTHSSSSRAGYAFLRRHREAVRLMLLFGLMNFFVAPVFLYLPLLTRDVLDGGGRELALLELAFALGNLLLFGYFALWPRHLVRTRWLRFILVAASAAVLWALGRTDTLGIMFALLLAWGASVGLVTYLAMTSFQRGIPDEFKGRFFALLASIVSMAVPLSFALFGFLIAQFPLPELMDANALGALLVSLGFLAVANERPSDRAV